MSFQPLLNGNGGVILNLSASHLETFWQTGLLQHLCSVTDHIIKQAWKGDSLITPLTQFTLNLTVHKS